EDAAGDVLPEEGREPEVRLEGARQDEGRHDRPRQGARDRREEDEGPERERRRGGHAHGRRLGPLDGPGSGGLTIMAKIAKRVTQSREGIDPNKAYALDEALKLRKDRSKVKFDETVEVAMNLGVDPRHADQMVRGVVNLPNGTGRTVRVAVFARGEK